MFNFRQYDWKKYNVSLIGIVTILMFISCYLVKWAADSDLKASYFRGQLTSMVFGIVIAVVVSLIDYHFICQFVLLYYILGLILLFLTKFSPLGTDLGTSCYRWLKLGINFQPSEVCKLFLILALAVFFTKYYEQLDRFKTLVLAGLITIGLTILIMLQPDLSSSLVMVFIFVMMVFASGMSYKILAPVVICIIPTLIGVIWYCQQPYQKLLKPYQYNRIFGFLHPEDVANSTMFQQNHSVQSIASGQLIGKALSDATSTVRSYFYVDVRESDFIFSVIGEELGFVGSSLIICLLALVIFKCWSTACKARDYLGKMIAIGIASMFMFQVFANIGVACRILPNTGLPLPFLSRGLTSLLGCSIGIGIVLNIGLQTKTNVRNTFEIKDLEERGI
ncbi:MAG: FtsW/RodA/SpoVE family cell cycle protein [Clostridiales bacterium]|nr:FtsW/RodA/SpoVE family cell cycle protein [Clostridiales bacterium]